MKTFIISILLCCVLSAPAAAQAADAEQRVKTKAEKFFSLCEEEKYDSMASMIIYSGKDKERYLSDTYNYSERKEATTVKRIGKKIKAFVDLSDSREFGAFSKSSDKDPAEYKLETEFTNGEQKLVGVFTFVEVNGELLLLKFQ